MKVSGHLTRLRCGRRTDREDALGDEGEAHAVDDHADDRSKLLTFAMMLCSER